MDNLLKMAKHLTLILLSFLLFSCASRKVSVTKTQIETHIDSISVERKDSVVVQQNAISMKEENDEIEVRPIDSTKPIIIGDTKYYNATIKIKKTRKSLIDTTKVVTTQSSQKQVIVQKDIKEKLFEKKIDKKPNYLLYLWLFLIPLAIYFARKYLIK